MNVVHHYHDAGRQLMRLFVFRGMFRIWPKSYFLRAVVTNTNAPVIAIISADATSLTTWELGH